MAIYLVLFSLAVWFSQVHTQACGPVVLPPPCTPCAPCPPPVTNPCVQVINPNPQVTTIIDNTVSNALVNALQLLIVSNLIGAAGAPVVGNLGPLLDCLACPNPCAEIITPCSNLQISAYTPCAKLEISPCASCANLEVISPCASCANLEVISPCAQCSNIEILPYAPAPVTCGPNFNLIPPCGPVIDYPPPFCGLTDIISPAFFAYKEPTLCLDTLPTTIFNGYPDAICSIYGIDTINPNYCGLTEIISPNYYPVAEIPYCGFADSPLPLAALSPNLFSLTEVPNGIPIYGAVPDVAFGPLAALAPNYFGGLEVSQVPLAEMVFPSAIPAQLACNFGYTQSHLPCVRLNVEPFPFEVCNGFTAPLYY